jgi:hypothetical protein
LHIYILALFGLKMLKEGYHMKHDSGLEELEEVQQELKEKDEERERNVSDIESQGPIRASQKLRGCFSVVFLQGKLFFTSKIKSRSLFKNIKFDYIYTFFKPVYC